MFYSVWYFLKHSTCSGTSHFPHANDVRPPQFLHRLYLLPVLQGQWFKLSNLVASVIATAIEDLLPCLLGFVPWRRRRVWATSLWKERRSFSPLFQDLNEWQNKHDRCMNVHRFILSTTSCPICRMFCKSNITLEFVMLVWISSLLLLSTEEH